jgi:hypothetical protein
MRTTRKLGSSPLAALALLMAWLPGAAQALTELADSYGACIATATSQTINLGPGGNYQATIDAAQAGQRIVLAGGTYTNGLRIYDLNAAPGNCIVIEGPADRSAVFVGQPLNGIRNVVQIRNSSYVRLRNLDIDGTGTTDLDGVKSDATIAGSYPAAWSHHITLENLHIHDFDADQQQVGISTKGPAWNWVVTDTIIERVGTGIYFGNSDGTQHFVNGLIEYNLLRDTIGYNMQVKHQFAASRPSGPGFETLPATGRTVIRHNVFHKSGNSSTGDDARPNLLVGAFPPTGNGSDDDYVIAQNFLYQNPTGIEALFQGEGNVALFGNVFYNSQGPALLIQPQNGEVRRIRVFQNTVLSSDDGIFISSNVNAGYTQLVRGNAVFASGTPIAGGSQAGNVSDSLANAGNYVVNPSGVVTGTINRMDLYPEPGALSGAAIDTAPIATFVDFDRDFNDLARDGVFRGAYGGEGVNPGWQLALAIKPRGPGDTLFANGFEDAP